MGKYFNENGKEIQTKEYLGKTVKIEIDRAMGSKHPKHGFLYPVNYGFIPETTAPDGEGIDVYVLGIFKPLQEYEGEVVAIIHRLNDDDDKLVVCEKGKKYSAEQIDAITEFQERFYKHEIWFDEKNSSFKI